MANWKGKVVVVTGGSSGLGLHIASAFAARDANVVVWGRDPQRLDQAVSVLQALGEGKATSQQVDVCDDQSVERGFAELRQHTPQIDVWVNNVGKSTRVSWRNAQLSQYQELMRLNFDTVVRCSQQALPLLELSGGHLVNIGSLSSKLAWPWMGPYTTSKFAVAGYTQQIQLEGPPQVHTLLVCPGPIRRNDEGMRYQSQTTELPQQASRPGAGAPIKGLDPRLVAQKIVLACERRQPRLLLPAKLRWLLIAQEVSARLGLKLLRKLAPKTD